MCRCNNKEIDKVIKELVAEGWKKACTGSGHIKLTPPKGKPIFIASTPSDHRAIHNILALIKRTKKALDAPEQFRHTAGTGSQPA